MIKQCILAFSLATASHVHAATIVDVYGVSPQESTQLLHKYGKRMTDIMVPLNQGLQTVEIGKRLPPPIERLVERREALIEEMKKKEDLRWVEFSVVLYPDNQDNFITMDVVKNSDKARFQFIYPPAPQMTKVETHDVIDAMSEYTIKSVHVFLDQRDAKAKSHNANQSAIKTAGKRKSVQAQDEIPCPVYHCFMGFTNPELKPYLPLFNRAAVKQRQLIIDTLNHDPDPARRASAAFLVGHFKNPRDIITILTPHVNDPDEIVRNNVIRVIAFTVDKAKFTDINPAPFLALLDSPSLTDRNKSLKVLLSAAQSKIGKAYLIEHGEKPLLAILRLKQPNNHKFAYQILKELSGRDYGDHNITAWQAWFKRAQAVVV